ncbi:MAG TPA: EAL domain-containing protein [Candidatus Omnitrophota bacterium]|nr:EAL domain-containing protein [Candidatus Omnitrophota bacterium]
MKRARKAPAVKHLRKKLKKAFLHHDALYPTFQPIVSIQTREIFAYEVLTRSRQKPFKAGKLFRSSYQQGHTLSLDMACLKKAFSALPGLWDGKLLFVNIEPVTMARIFDKGGEGHSLMKQIIPHREKIVFELTEGMKSSDFGFVQKGVRALKRYGCRFALDDISGIGVKFFKLLTLKPSFLKLDASLIQDLIKNRWHRLLVRRLIKLAAFNRILLIAEGVEKKKEFELVKSLGIPYVQGFFFARPKRNLLRKLS